MLLQLLEDDNLTGNKDRTVSFDNTLVMMISKRANLFLDDLRKTSEREDTHLAFPDAAIRRVDFEGRDPHFGARPLGCAVDKLIGSPISKDIIGGRTEHGGTVHVHVDPDGRVVFEPAP
jgi:ATP-dependent Clp protease ATP-binding subunit ClpA